MTGRSSTMLIVVLLFLACVLGMSTHVRAEVDYDASVDGFDDSSSSDGVKTVTDVSALNLNPFQVELFVSYCIS